MSESILKALMQLFAIIAKPNSDEAERRTLVENFLQQQLNQDLVDEYLIVFDNYYHKNQKRNTNKRRKHIAASSVRVLTICTLINKELTLKQKSIVVLRLLEFINSEGKTTEQEFEFVLTVADTFNVPREEYEQFRALVFDTYADIPDDDNILIIAKENTHSHYAVNFLQSPNLLSPIIVLRTCASNMYMFVYHGKKELYLNGQLIHQHRVYILSAGASIRDVKRHPIYYSDIVSAFLTDGKSEEIYFEARDISYQFSNGNYGVYRTSFTEKSGKLIGLMGASGSGKSTLLNVLNGSIKPSSGEVLINGVNVHTEKNEIEGIIGHVSQDDLLIEELTVLQNLYFNAKLCFGNYPKRKLYRLVIETLKNLGLYDIKDLKVGSPLNKKISGGQRKRLNIALELIREPAVLFLDEPTSGLSSRDSEMIMDILKELALKGKLIFVVIHQPSSEIFKMFDRLMILDQGGYMVYDGDPVESIVYFKSGIKQADWNSGECSVCGNVNPEQIFNILESEVLDEYGNRTSTRKVSPHQWFNLFRKKTGLNTFGGYTERTEKTKLPAINFKIPNAFKQFKIFIHRDFLSKITNIQYLLINLLEAPILALLLSYIIKYYNVEANEGYVYAKNDNIPIYIFMGVIIALFMGLTISADEIIKDQKIRKRESFLNLSRFSYLSSKIFILFLISAYQALVFVLLGNTILEIRDMYWEYWAVLFSTWAFAVLLGLNISDGFKTSVAIYITIPFLIIPQIVLSGIIVQYEKLNPAISSPESIPWFGEIMTARWSYEALTVNQFVNNKYEKPLYPTERIKKNANYKKDLWIKEIENKIGFYERHKSDTASIKECRNAAGLIISEISKEQSRIKRVVPQNINFTAPDSLSEKNIEDLKLYLQNLKRYYMHLYNDARKKQQAYILAQTATDSLNKDYTKLKMTYHNDRLESFVTNRSELQKIIEYNGALHQKSDMIYQYPETFLKAHFYAPKKRIFGMYYDTLSVNTAVVWLFTLFLAITLQFSLFRKFLDFPNYVKNKIEKRRTKL